MPPPEAAAAVPSRPAQRQTGTAAAAERVAGKPAGSNRPVEKSGNAGAGNSAAARARGHAPDPAERKKGGFSAMLEAALVEMDQAAGGPVQSVAPDAAGEPGQGTRAAGQAVLVEAAATAVVAEAVPAGQAVPRPATVPQAPPGPAMPPVAALLPALAAAEMAAQGPAETGQSPVTGGKGDPSAWGLSADGPALAGTVAAADAAVIASAKAAKAGPAAADAGRDAKAAAGEARAQARSTVIMPTGTGEPGAGDGLAAGVPAARTEDLAGAAPAAGGPGAESHEATVGASAQAAAAGQAGQVGGTPAGEAADKAGQEAARRSEGARDDPPAGPKAGSARAGDSTARPARATEEVRWEAATVRAQAAPADGGTQAPAAPAGAASVQPPASAGRADAPAAPAGAGRPVATAADQPAPESIPQQISAHFRDGTGRAGQEVVIRLNPPELGSVRLSFHADGNALRGELKVSSPQTLQELRTEAAGLFKHLADNGVQVRRLDITLEHQGTPAHSDWLARDGRGQQYDGSGGGYDRAGQQSFAGHQDNPGGEEDQAPHRAPADGSVNLWA